MKELKHSRKREAILETLKNRYDHPTAEMVYQSLREMYPNISLGTVYRNLSQLKDMGEITTLSVEDGTERYDYMTEDHVHFVCRECGKVIDLETKEDIDFNKVVKSKGKAHITSHKLVYYGCCEECYKKQKIKI